MDIRVQCVVRQLPAGVTILVFQKNGHFLAKTVKVCFAFQNDAALDRAGDEDPVRKNFWLPRR